MKRPGTLVRGAVRLLTQPLLPDDFVALVAPLAATDALRARIVARRPEAAGAATLVLRIGRGWRPHTPGQYVRLGVEVDGVRHWRAYSITAASPGLIEVTVKPMPDGVVSNHLTTAPVVGKVVVLDQAAGDFVLPSPPPARILFLTGGSGLTPVMGMLRARPLGDVVVLHSAPTPGAVLFGPELRALAAAGRVRLLERHTATAGTLAMAELDHLVPDWRERETYVCGPVGLLAAAETHWAAAGLAGRLHAERFRRAVTVVGEGGVISFAAAGARVHADGATPILDAGEAAGVLLPSGCRMGICFGCVRPLVAGAVRDLRTGAVTIAPEHAPVNIQTCVSAAAGACTLDA